MGQCNEINVNLLLYVVWCHHGHSGLRLRYLSRNTIKCSLPANANISGGNGYQSSDGHRFCRMHYALEVL